MFIFSRGSGSRGWRLKVRCGELSTFEFCDVHLELVPLFEDALSAFGDKVVEAVGEAGHAFAEIVETEIYVREGVGHGGGTCGGERAVGGGEGVGGGDAGFEKGGHWVGLRWICRLPASFSPETWG